MTKVKPKKKVVKGILYARGISKLNIDWAKGEADRLGYYFAEYLDELFTTLRESKNVSKKRKL